MKNHKTISRNMNDKDEEVLKHLIDIRYEKHQEGHGFELKFTFTENEFFSNTTLSKNFFMEEENVLQKTVGTAIEWKEGKNILKKKVKKKQKNKKTGQQRTVVKEVDDESSFFNLFRSIELPSKEEMDRLDSEEQDELGDKLD